MNNEPFYPGQKVRYRAGTSPYAGEESTVKECKYDGLRWVVYFTDGPWAPNGKERAELLEAVPSPESSEPKFKLRQRAIAKRFPGSPGSITKIVLRVGVQPHYGLSSYAGLLSEFELQEIPDTVMIEVERSIAIAILTQSDWYEEALKKACRKALGR